MPVTGSGSSCPFSMIRSLPGLLGHEDAAVGQEVEAPWRGHALGDRLQPEGRLLARDHDVGRRLVEGGLLAPGPRAHFADVDDHRPHFLRRQHGFERRHAAGIALLDHPGEVGIGAAELPDVVDQAAELGAFELRAVAVGAELSVELADLAFGRGRLLGAQVGAGGGDTDAQDDGQVANCLHRTPELNMRLGPPAPGPSGSAQRGSRTDTAAIPRAAAGASISELRRPLAGRDWHAARTGRAA